MPQMSPMMWLMLFFFFLIIFLFFNILNYFNFLPLNTNKFSSQNKNNNFKFLTWKW